MSQRIYEMTHGRFIIHDDILDIHIDEPFVFTQMPDDLSSCIKDSCFAVSFFSGGSIEKIYTVRDGKRHGPSIHLDEMGCVLWRGCYCEDKLHGPSEFFSEKQTLLSSTWFYHGMQSGLSSQYYPSGAPCCHLSYKNAQLHGTALYYYEDGSLRSSFIYREGVLDGPVELYHESGKIKRVCRYVLGKKEGIDRIVSKDGIVLDEGEYVASRPCGIHLRRYPSGALREKIIYHTDGAVEKLEWNEMAEPIEGERCEPVL